METITDLSALFTQDLTNIDITRPLIADKTLGRFRITDLKVMPNKHETGQIMKVDLVSEDDLRDNKNTLHPAGFFKLFHRMSITPTEEYTLERVQQELKKLMAACNRTGAFGDPSSYIGEVVTAMVVIEKDKNGVYDDQNRIKYFVAKKG